MSSVALGYSMNGLGGLMTHGWKWADVARDGSLIEQEIEAQVRSGDYFVTLATILDLLSRQASDYDTKIRLENIVSDLIYLQDNYEITKNKQAG